MMAKADRAHLADALPSYLLGLAEGTTRFRDQLATLRFSELFAAVEALQHAQRAASLSEAAKAVTAELGKVGLYVSPAVRDTFSRLQLLATQAQLADEHLTWVHVYLDELTSEERAQRPCPPGRVLDTLLEAGRHLREADTLTALGAPDALHAATDLAVALREQKVSSRVQPMSAAQYAALHAAASGHVSVDVLGNEEWAWNRLGRISMATVRSLESRGWIFREAYQPVPGSRLVRIHLTEAGRTALASRLGRIPLVTRPRAVEVQPARTRVH
ncbi:hypothetical protein ACWGI1_00290 [Streptomyces sp. NPDC054835]|uniref:hypothetical protein n=1 Tax=Streptomyces exfoliatus TaxID=1905 RepID=UPI0004642C0E|nr:hypothetical protein [Streptomyces exfoliatus]